MAASPSIETSVADGVQGFSSSYIKKIGVCTCGGDCPGLNAVIRAVVLAAENRGWEVLGIRKSTAGLIDLSLNNVVLTSASVDGLHAKGGTILGSTNKSHPFAYVVKDAEGHLQETDVSDKLIENFHKLNLDALVVIGGDGSQAIAHKLFKKGLPVVGVPKTIDNDLLATERTFGFETAVQTITESLDRIADTAKSHNRCIIVETMGRNAGWLALHAGIAGAADIVLLPEIPYDPLLVLKKLWQRAQAGIVSNVIVVAEGSFPSGGSVATLETKKAGEMLRLGGAAEVLSRHLQAANVPSSPHYYEDLQVRVTNLGYIQRGGTPTAGDRILAQRFGVKAVQLIEEGLFGHVVVLEENVVKFVTLETVAAGQQLVDPVNDDTVAVARELGICFGDAVPAKCELSISECIERIESVAKETQRCHEAQRKRSRSCERGSGHSHHITLSPSPENTTGLSAQTSDTRGRE